MKKVALISGITGQDGSYLAELLLSKGYKVHGILRRNSSDFKGHLEKIYKGAHTDSNLKIHYGDLTDSSVINFLVKSIQPDEIYNLAAQSHVRISFDIPEYTANVDAFGTLRFLEAIRLNDLSSKTKFYQASTSELYGKVQEVPQTETTPFYPRSPYAVAKMYSYWIVVNYREAYGIHASNGILFNHESFRRGDAFITKKIVKSAIKIKNGELDCLYLGNLYSKRDWGYAPEYVEAMWRILQLSAPNDIVLATGETHTVKEFANLTFAKLDMKIEWVGDGINEIGLDKKSGKELIKIDPYYYRPTEVDLLIGDATKAKKILGWEPKVKFKDLIEIMVNNELNGREDD